MVAPVVLVNTFEYCNYWLSIQLKECSSRRVAELLFQVFADRYERGSLLITSNLPFSEWGQVFQGERMIAALLDRLTHHCHIFEMNGQSYRFRESAKKNKVKTRLGEASSRSREGK